MLVVLDPADAERRLGAGELGCTACGGRLGPWGHARSRQVRGPGGRRWWLRPRRVRCAGCGATQVLLPASVLARRADSSESVGIALLAAATGRGHRPIAQTLGVPADTARGWLRRARQQAPWLRAVRFAGGTGTEELLRSVQILAELYATGARKVPPDAPAGFVPARWAGYLDAAAAAGNVTGYRHYWARARVRVTSRHVGRRLARGLRPAAVRGLPGL